MVSFVSTGSGGSTRHGPDNPIAWDGYVFNPETGQYHVRFRWYDPVLGRWLERDSTGYVDGMNVYELTKSAPSVFNDPTGTLSACMTECLKGHYRWGDKQTWDALTDEQREYGYERPYMHPTGETDRSQSVWRYPELEMFARCKKLCSCPDGTCTPKGRLTVRHTPSEKNKPYQMIVRFDIDGEDPNCCSEMGIVQFVRQKSSILWWSAWKIDDGRVGGRSHKSRMAPFYTDTMGDLEDGAAWLELIDEPGSWEPQLKEYVAVVMCTRGPAAGHIYGAYHWFVGTSGYETWQPATGTQLLGRLTEWWCGLSSLHDRTGSKACTTDPDGSFCEAFLGDLSDYLPDFMRR